MLLWASIFGQHLRLEHLLPGRSQIVDPDFLALPCLLLVYYFVVWLWVGRDPKPGVLVPQYCPPANMSPAEMRYLLTGTCDRKTVASVLAHLAAQGVISIHPEAEGYRITLLTAHLPATLPPEEIAALDALTELNSFSVPVGVKPPEPPNVLLQPSEGKAFSLVTSVVIGSLRKRVGSLYLTRNLRFSLPATAVSIAAALATAVLIHHRDALVFLTLWFLLFSLGLGLIIATNVLPSMRDALRGTLRTGNIARTFLPLPIFLAVPGFVAVLIGRASNPAFAGELIALVVLNIAGGILIENITLLARERMDQVEGFKQYLASVELDSLRRMNAPRLAPALLNDYLAYAIALDLKEPWGDHLSDALFATTTCSG